MFFKRQPFSACIHLCDEPTQYRLGEFQGTHAIGHTRMATESDVDIRSAHPYWAYPFSDVSVVHNGQLTNYWRFLTQMYARLGGCG